VRKTLVLAGCLLVSGCGQGIVLPHPRRALVVNCWALRKREGCPRAWDARALLGKPYLQAISEIAAHHSGFQLERLNGEWMLVLLDLDPSRVDLYVVDGIVTHVSVG
jgi:hypothetical protein